MAKMTFRPLRPNSGRSEKRVLINGSWRRVDPAAAALTAWFRGDVATAAMIQQRAEGSRFERLGAL